MQKLAALLASLSLTACAVGPDYVRPDATLPKEFIGANQKSFTQEEVPSRFWSVFDDEVLSGLIEEALTANHDLRIAAVLVRELGVNPAGVEVALHLRRRLLALEERARRLAQALARDEE